MAGKTLSCACGAQLIVPEQPPSLSHALAAARAGAPASELLPHPIELYRHDVPGAGLRRLANVVPPYDALNLPFRLAAFAMVILAAYWFVKASVRQKHTMHAVAPPVANAMPSEPTVAANDDDRRIADHISQWRDLSVFEGREWKDVLTRSPRDYPTMNLINQMYAAGAVKVYVDELGGSAIKNSQRLPVGEMYVELPADPANRHKCIDVARQYCSQFGGKIESVSTGNANDATGRFVVIQLAKQRG